MARLRILSVAWLAAACTLSGGPALASSVVFGTGANQFTIEFVTIGNPGNVADLTGNPFPAGGVDYVYEIGKFEVSRDMISKANNEGGLGITLSDMTFLGGNGPDKPAVAPGLMPAWEDAARFVNWLNTSSGYQAAYKFDAGNNFQLWTPSDAGYDPSNRYRNSLARYVLPSSDEWYKAAYHDASAGTAGTYFNYATGSDTAPTAVASGTTPGTAVYNQVLSQGPAEIANAGGLSPYGTMAQGGNVQEWVETAFDLQNDSPDGGYLRGGGWGAPASDMSSSSLYGVNFGQSTGFRVAITNVPEPGTASLVLLGLGALALRRRRRAP
jgi:hypothetical protein